MRTFAAGAAAVVLLAGCSDGAADTDKGLRDSVESYSLAYLAGDGQTAWDLLSARCQKRITPAQMREMSIRAVLLFGPHEISKYEADVQGTLARVTYSYVDAASINQTSEPWTKEGGIWRQDDC